MTVEKTALYRKLCRHSNPAVPQIRCRRDRGYAFYEASSTTAIVNWSAGSRGRAQKEIDNFAKLRYHKR